MPTYLYRRDDGTTFELQQRITEDALTHDPDTGQAVTRIPARGAGFVLKGTGFYQTDYKPAPKDAAPASIASSEAASSGTNEGASAGTNAEGGTTTKTDTPSGD